MEGIKLLNFVVCSIGIPVLTMLVYVYCIVSIRFFTAYIQQGTLKIANANLKVLMPCITA